MLKCTLGIFLFALSLSTYGESFSIGVAANFKDCLQALESDFRQSYPQHHLEFSTASSGVLYAQILAGAPFDVFLSADDVLTGKLLKQGIGEQEFTYAIGKLVLWVSRSSGSEVIDEAYLSTYTGRLAIANPLTAPYGQAAESILKKRMGNTDASYKIITGNNVAQAYQFVASGNAEAGLLALSLVYKNCHPGNCWIVPGEYYSPIHQNAVLIVRHDAKGNSLTVNNGAADFIEYLRSKEAREIILSKGYDIPNSYSPVSLETK